MNLPLRREMIYLPPGVKKITVLEDTKFADAALFRIEREDHTIGNLIRMQLLKDKNVLFAGYKVPHPLEPVVEIKVQTNRLSDPVRAFEESVRKLTEDIGNLTDSFKDQIARNKGAEGGHDAYA